jgi:hypothetical protein
VTKENWQVYGTRRERENKGRDKDGERRGGEKEDGKRQRSSQIERGVVHILWSFAAAKVRSMACSTHKHSSKSAIFSGEARKEGLIAEARCASKLMKPLCSLPGGALARFKY